MGIKYLSDEWFTKVDELAEEVNLEVTEAGKAIKFNFTITSDDGDVDYCVEGGMMKKGHIDDATTKLIVPRDFAYKMFILQDQAAGMAAFSSGKLKVEGDMSKLMALQSMQPTESQKLLGEKIKEMTEE